MFFVLEIIIGESNINGFCIRKNSLIVNVLVKVNSVFRRNLVMTNELK